MKICIKKETQKNLIWIIIGVVSIILYLYRSMIGFRWPSIYVMSNHVVTSKFCFMPRTLVSNIVKLLVGDNLYKRTTLYVLILGVASAFIIYVAYNIAKYVIFNKNILFFFFFFSFIISPYAKYFLHEAGYYEQYGYLLGLLLVEIASKKNLSGWKTVSIYSSLFSLVSVLISETNLFLIVPFMFSIAVIDIVSSNEKIIRRFIFLFLIYIPSVLYSLAANLIRIPKEMVDKIQEYDLERVDFYVVDIYKYFWNDRSNQDIWGRTLHEIPIECIILPAMLVFIIFIIVLIQGGGINKKIAVSYFTLCALCGLFNYSIVIMAWDLSRYYFCIYMQIFIITFYILKRHFVTYQLKKYEMVYFMLYILAIIGMSKFEFDLFDGRVYLRTVQEMLNEIKGFTSY